MSISGTYFIRKWIPDPRLVHGEGFKPVPPPDRDGPGGPPGAGEAQIHVDLPDYGKPCPDFFEGEVTFVLEARPDGTLAGTANGDAIHSGFHTGEEFFTVDYQAGPGRWEIWARVDERGDVTGMVSVGGGGFPNFAYGKKIA